jgi:CheY-like chemotaxis protein/HPt (histidine-containing phosphotransfer) domain-containing protein
MSHEIRTPLNAVIGFTEQLSGSRLNTDQTTYVERIQRSGQHLRQLINDILDYAKLESGKVSLENIGFQPVQHVRDVVALLEKKAADKGLYIKTETAADIPEVLIGDPVRLNQVIINLVDNALKFTKKGGVSINLSADRSSDSGILLKISITDTGIGIPKDKIETIFEDFAQADSSTTREFGGTGLGLSIVKKIIDTMNGRLDVQSEEDKGTTFTVSLPFSKGTTDDIPLNRIEKKSVDFSGRSILIVDDQPFNIELAETILTRTGATVKSCHNGLEALENLENNQFDIVLMDIQMPEMSGLEATKQLRKSKGINRDTRIIALTAGSSDKDKTMAIEAGMNDILLKPFTQDDLLNIISSHLEETDADLVTNEPDLTNLASLSNGDESFVIHMLDIFLDNSEKDLHALENCKDDDFSRIQALAHKMKPPCRHLGLEMTVNTLKEIEEAAALEDSGTIDILIDRLAQEFQTIHPAIEKELRNLRKGKAQSSA